MAARMFVHTRKCMPRARIPHNTLRLLKYPQAQSLCQHTDSHERSAGLCCRCEAWRPQHGCLSSTCARNCGRVAAQAVRNCSSAGQAKAKHSEKACCGSTGGRIGLVCASQHWRAFQRTHSNGRHACALCHPRVNFSAHIAMGATRAATFLASRALTRASCPPQDVSCRRATAVSFQFSLPSVQQSPRQQLCPARQPACMLQCARARRHATSTAASGPAACTV